MNSNRKLLFILNPVAGSGKARSLQTLIANFFENSNHSFDIIFTNKKGDAIHLAKKAQSDGFDTVVAVGGDGTINEVAIGLLNTSCSMGIIPVGSGNGLARHYNIPFNIQSAINIILKNKIVSHDAIRINEYYSFNVSGIGFDAHIAHLFNKSKTRGFFGYAKLVIKEYFKYQPTHVLINDNNEKIMARPFLIAIANTSQFGNNAFIAPTANSSDGKVDLTIVNKLSLVKVFPIIWKLFNKQLKPAKNIDMRRNTSFIISSEFDFPLHIDGEASGFHKNIKINVQSRAINFIIP